MSTTTKKVSDSATETLHIVRPNHLNAAGRLFGGVLMQWIDELAGLVAKRHSHMNVTTASVDNLRFLKGAYQRDVVVISGKITYVGNTSMEVRVDSYVEDLDGVRTPINRAYFTMVALDENDKPCTVPRLTLTTASQRGAPDEERSGNLVNPHFFIFSAFHASSLASDQSVPALLRIFPL